MKAIPGGPSNQTKSHHGVHRFFLLLPPDGNTTWFNYQIQNLTCPFLHSKFTSSSDNRGESHIKLLSPFIRLIVREREKANSVWFRVSTTGRKLAWLPACVYKWRERHRYDWPSELVSYDQLSLFFVSESNILDWSKSNVWRANSLSIKLLLLTTSNPNGWWASTAFALHTK